MCRIGSQSTAIGSSTSLSPNSWGSSVPPIYQKTGKKSPVLSSLACPRVTCHSGILQSMSRLRTPSFVIRYLDKEALRHRIESGMSWKLTLRCRLEKTGKVAKFEDWLMEIKRVNGRIRMERVEFKALAKSTCKASRRSNTL